MPTSFTSCHLTNEGFSKKNFSHNFRVYIITQPGEYLKNILFPDVNIHKEAQNPSGHNSLHFIGEVKTHLVRILFFTLCQTFTAARCRYIAASIW